MENKQILAAAKELNKLFFDADNPQICTNPKDMDQVKSDILEAVKDCLKPDDELTPETQMVINTLEDEENGTGGEEAEESKEEEKEETNEDADDSEGDESLFDKVDGAKTLKDLVTIAKAHEDLFSYLKLSSYKDDRSLRDDMLDLIEKEEKKGKKPVGKVPAKEKEVKEKKPAEKEEKKVSSKAGKKPDFGKRGDESFPAMAQRFLKEGTSEKDILAAYKAAYKERKGITDEKFVKARVAIYMKLAEEKK